MGLFAGQSSAKNSMFGCLASGRGDEPTQSVGREEIKEIEEIAQRLKVKGSGKRH